MKTVMSIKVAIYTGVLLNVGVNMHPQSSLVFLVTLSVDGRSTVDAQLIFTLCSIKDLININTNYIEIFY